MTNITLFNPGFETGLNADARTIVICSQNTSTVSADATAHTGSYSAKWNPNVSQGINYVEVVPQVPNQTDAHIPSQRGTHTFTIWIKTNLVQGAHSLILKLEAYDANNNILQTDTFTPDATVPVSTAWQQFTVTQAPVTFTEYIQPSVELTLTEDLNNASFYFDDMALDVQPESAPQVISKLNVDNIRLEVEVPTTGLVNLVPNPDGETGTWGYETPISNTSITIGAFWDCPMFTTHVAQAAYWTTTLMPVAAGKYVTGRFDAIAATGGSNNVKCRFEFYDATGTYLASSPQSAAFNGDFSTKYTLTAQAPTNTAYVKLRWDLYNGTGNPMAGDQFSFTHVMVIASDTAGVNGVPRVNLFPNPNFKNDLSYWNGFSDNVTALTYTTNVYHNNPGSMGMSPKRRGNSYLESSDLDCVGGRDYTVSAMTRSNGGTRVSFIGLAFYNGTKYLTGQGFAFSCTAEWGRMQTTLTAPSNATKVRLWWEVDRVQINDRFWLDEVLLEESLDVGTYFDGDTPSTADYTYSWEGAAEASKSVEQPAANTFDYAPPTTWRNIMGPTSEINITREALDVGTLTAVVRDALLDPATADTIRPGKKVRLRTYDESQDAWNSAYTGVLTEASTSYNKQKTVNGQVKVVININATDNIAVLANEAEPHVLADIADLPAALEDKDVPWNVNGSGGQTDKTLEEVTLAINDNASAVDCISVARDSSLGYAWVDRHNVLNAWDSASMDATVLGTFSDAGAGLSYSDIAVDFSTDTCINSVTINYLRYDIGTNQTTEISYGPYKDTESINIWGVHSADFTIVLDTEDESAIAAYAQAILTANAVPAIKCHSLVMPVRSADEVNSATVIDLYSLVHVTYADKLDMDLRITSINHQLNATPDGAVWTVTYGFDGIDSVAQPTWVPSPNAYSSKSVGVWNFIGEVKMFAGATAPTGWMLCDGSAVSRSDYADLFAVIGTTFGNGDGSTTFNLPDMRSRFPAGAGGQLVLGGSDGQNEPNRTPAHDHSAGTLSTSNFTHNTYNQAPGGGGGSRLVSPATHNHNVTGRVAQNGGWVGSGGFPRLGLNFIIRAKP